MRGREEEATGGEVENVAMYVEMKPLDCGTYPFGVEPSLIVGYHFQSQKEKKAMADGMCRRGRRRFRLDSNFSGITIESEVLKK